MSKTTRDIPPDEKRKRDGHKPVHTETAASAQIHPRASERTTASEVARIIEEGASRSAVDMAERDEIYKGRA